MNKLKEDLKNYDSFSIESDRADQSELNDVANQFSDLRDSLKAEAFIVFATTPCDEKHPGHEKEHTRTIGMTTGREDHLMALVCNAMQKSKEIERIIIVAADVYREVKKERELKKGK